MSSIGVLNTVLRYNSKMGEKFFFAISIKRSEVYGEIKTIFSPPILSAKVFITGICCSTQAWQAVTG